MVDHAVSRYYHVLGYVFTRNQPDLYKSHSYSLNRVLSFVFILILVTATLQLSMKIIFLF